MKYFRFKVFLLVGALFFSSCQTQLDSEVEELEPIIVSAKVTVGSSPDVKESYNYLEIKLDPSGLVPDLIVVKGRPLFDNGEGNDKFAGDYIFSSINPVKFPGANPSGRENATDGYIRCEFDASLAGEDCGGKTCPDKTAWGFNTWFCVCFSDCEFCLGEHC